MRDKEITIWSEMARRKLQFHESTEWNKITLWGLFSWGYVSFLIKNGLLITNMSKENKTIWVKPSKDAYERFIKPLLETFNLAELTYLAGWKDEYGNPLDKSINSTCHLLYGKCYQLLNK